MLILGVDTSGKNGSIALVRFVPDVPRTLELLPLEGGTFSAQLVPQISELLNRHHLTKREIDGFAVVSGPGSFTGLRVGLGAIKALAEILQKPIAAVSLLEAVARASGKTGDVTAVLDAGRGEAYAAKFSITENRVAKQEEALLAMPDVVLQSAHEIVTPCAKIAGQGGDRNPRVHFVPYPMADFIAKLGFEKIKNGDTVDAIHLDANYIRRSDAEVKKETTQSQS